MELPALNFGHGEDIDMLRDSVRRFAAQELTPRIGQRVKAFALMLALKLVPSFLLITTPCWPS